MDIPLGYTVLLDFPILFDFYVGVLYYCTVILDVLQNDLEIPNDILLAVFYTPFRNNLGKLRPWLSIIL